MKILVCISSVPDTTSKINFTADKSAFDKNGIQWVINPLDEFALTKAVKLQESQGATVTVINVGDIATEPVIRKALAIGANDAVRVNLDPKDSYSTAKEIAAVAQNGGYDLILCGKESIDYNGGSVPGMVAQLLNQPFVNASVGLDVNGSEATATAIREIEGGKETISVKLPAVIAGQKGLVDEKELIIPNMRGIMSARTKPLQVVEPTSSEVKVQGVSYDSVPPRAAVKMVSPDNLDELVRLLHEEAKVI
jgi:electron transfer flavoprotein beta subunit